MKARASNKEIRKKHFDKGGGPATLRDYIWNAPSSMRNSCAKFPRPPCKPSLKQTGSEMLSFRLASERNTLCHWSPQVANRRNGRNSAYAFVNDVLTRHDDASCLVRVAGDLMSFSTSNLSRTSCWVELVQGQAVEDGQLPSIEVHYTDRPKCGLFVRWFNAVNMAGY